MTYLVINLRKTCDIGCGYDKAKTFGIDFPITLDLIQEHLQKEADTFSAHEHASTVTHSISSSHPSDNMGLPVEGIVRRYEGAEPR